ncbi:MAG: dihydroorotate dehydrogenase electron transfer subunit [Oscillospiraceae bacterium]
MDYIQALFPITKKSNLSKNCYSFTIKCPEIASIAQPGQFVHIKADGFMLRRPISICEIDKTLETIRIVLEIRGEGTEKIADLREGELIDMIGPLGNGFSLLDRSKKIIAIGGGIGTPPMLEIAKRYNNSTAIIGFRNASAVILADDFKSYGIDTHICTDDGTMGFHGYVTTALSKQLEIEKPDIIFACGPHLMLKGIIEIANKNNIKCEVSLEERMGCGVGACLVCACKTVKNGEEYFAHVCKDGPVFDSKEVLL